MWRSLPGILSRHNCESPRASTNVFLELAIGDAPAGRLTFRLFADRTPLAAENFRALCTGEKGRSLTFLNSCFHRIVPNFVRRPPPSALVGPRARGARRLRAAGARAQRKRPHRSHERAMDCAAKERR